MKVRYTVIERLTFSGEIEMSEKDFIHLNAETDTEYLGEIILNQIDRNNPTDFEILDVEEFEPA